MDDADFRTAIASAHHHLNLAIQFINLGRHDQVGDHLIQASEAAAQALALDPTHAIAATFLTLALLEQHLPGPAAKAARRPDVAPKPPRVGVVIAALDEGAGRHRLRDLLGDLERLDGEVAVVFNDPDLGARFKDHPRINKWAMISANSGVARAWNIGINLIEAEIAAILNADLRLSPIVIEGMAQAIAGLPDAMAVGLGGEFIDPSNLRPLRQLIPGTFSAPTPVDKLTGYCFTLHLGRAHDAGFTFDPRLAPYFFEELDLAIKARAKGLEIYAVPVDVRSVDHAVGISQKDTPIKFFGHQVDRVRVLARNRGRLAPHWLVKPQKT